ncbi:MAG: ATPase domain-containing protein, partial [Dokdonella sp.]
MAKAKTAYVCNECGSEHNKWQGQCADCGAWNTLSEFVVQAATKAVATNHGGYAGASTEAATVTPLASVVGVNDARSPTGIAELDRVLGGGLVAGSVVLIGGDPGIGKSTLLLQMLGTIGQRLRSLYVTGEESLAQVAARGQRLGLALEGLNGLAETSIERILAEAQQSKPEVVIIDSIQTIWTELLSAAPGSACRWTTSMPCRKRAWRKSWRWWPRA